MNRFSTSTHLSKSLQRPSATTAEGSITYGTSLEGSPSRALKGWQSGHSEMQTRKPHTILYMAASAPPSLTERVSWLMSSSRSLYPSGKDGLTRAERPSNQNLCTMSGSTLNDFKKQSEIQVG